jgi:hypothetical protein
LAEIISEVVAIVRQDIVFRTVELGRGPVNDGADLSLRRKGETVQYFGAESDTGVYYKRLRPVHARFTSVVMSTIRVFLAVDNHTRVKEGCADGP